jgi:TatD DNase family protein
MYFIDTHAHLDFDQLGDDLPMVLANAHSAGIERIITVGTTLERSRKCVDLAAVHDNVWAAVGVHPADSTEIADDSHQVTEAALAELRKLAAHPRVVAVGEIGFDFYHPDNPSEASQQTAFMAQGQIAIEAGLPLIIHSRNAEQLTPRYLSEHADLALADYPARREPGVVLCFTGSRDFAQQVLDLGYLISFTAPVTYPKNDNLREVVKAVPLEKIMLETDAPFLPPADRRGKRNEPAYLIETAKAVAELKGISLDQLAEATTANAERLFGLS